MDILSVLKKIMEIKKKKKCNNSKFCKNAKTKALYMEFQSCDKF